MKGLSNAIIGHTGGRVEGRVEEEGYCAEGGHSQPCDV